MGGCEYVQTCLASSYALLSLLGGLMLEVGDSEKWIRGQRCIKRGAEREVLTGGQKRG